MGRYRTNTKNPQKRVNNKSVEKKRKTSANPANSSTSSSSGKFYYSFFTIILLLCLIQITVSAVLNISKIVSYNAKIIQITHTRDAAQALNDQLKDNIQNFSNVQTLEAIARNNLKMSSEDEVMVIINQAKSEETQEKNKKFGFIKTN